MRRPELLSLSHTRLKRKINVLVFLSNQKLKFKGNVSVTTHASDSQCGTRPGGPGTSCSTGCWHVLMEASSHSFPITQKSDVHSILSWIEKKKKMDKVSPHVLEHL